MLTKGDEYPIHQTPEPRCLVHGDFRPDDMLFNLSDANQPIGWSIGKRWVSTAARAIWQISPVCARSGDAPDGKKVSFHVIGTN
jgi:hypothetical protein